MNLFYGYFQPQYADKVKLCYMDTDSFIIYIQTYDFYKDISKDAKERFDASRYSKDR